MNNDAILASISKIHAYRYAKEKQKGVLTANGGFSITDPALMQVPFTIQCVIRPVNLTSTLQVAFNTKGDSSNPRVDLDESGNIVIYGGGSILYNKPANLNSIYDIVFVATDSQLSLFVDGTLITSVFYVNTISLYNIGCYFNNNQLYFQGDYLLHRHFNYAISVDEVKTLDNSGNPLGYVIPKVMKSGDNKCIAEYLPQNLVGSSIDKTIATIWLDSAKQFPWSDAYPPPLLESKGGYDMVANGAPEVLFNE